MGELEKVSQAQLNSALTPTGGRLQKRLSNEDGIRLTDLLNRTAKRYPSQDLADAMPEYMADYEKLALKYSLRKVVDAVEKLRIDPEQTFFPKPDEVADQIERSSERGRYDSNHKLYEAQMKRLEEDKARDFQEYGDWRSRWLASGLSLMDFNEQDDADRAAGRGFYADRGRQ